jgi:hypothetical protein
MLSASSFMQVTSPRAVDAGRPQGLVARRVASNAKMTVSLRPIERVLVDIDDHEVGPGAAEVTGDLAADAAVAAEDEMPIQAIDSLLHAPPLPGASEVALEDILHDRREGVEGPADTREDQADGEQPTDRRERVDLAEADRRDRGDGHVQGIEHRPALDPDVAGRPHRQHQHQDHDRSPKLAQLAHGAILDRMGLGGMSYDWVLSWIGAGAGERRFSSRLARM